MQHTAHVCVMLDPQSLRHALPAPRTDSISRRRQLKHAMSASPCQSLCNVAHVQVDAQKKRAPWTVHSKFCTITASMQWRGLDPTAAASKLCRAPCGHGRQRALLAAQSSRQSLGHAGLAMQMWLHHASINLHKGTPATCAASAPHFETLMTCIAAACACGVLPTWT